MERFHSILENNDLGTPLGVIDKIVGLRLESIGPMSKIGDICKIQTQDNEEVVAEVVGIDGNRVFLMPYTSVDGIGYGSTVYNTNRPLEIGISEAMLGCIIDPMGNPLDADITFEDKTRYPVNRVASNPFQRPRIDEPLSFGVKAIDGLLTVGKGQRMGIFAGSGVGKSTLMGMIARNVTADINIIALVGERGREVNEFIERDLGEEGLKRSILVVATSDQSAMMRSKCALSATAIAEYFKDKGCNVLLMMDSLTRFAMAEREIGLSIGEAPIARGYTPSIYTSLPKLLERAGKFETGSITGLYTVLVEGDDANEPISDTVRSIIDGHIMLSRKIAMKNHYPAIDVLASVSRLMNDIASKKQKDLAGILRNLMALHEENSDLLLIGAYKKGANPQLDLAISKIDAIQNFLKQPVDVAMQFEDTVIQMERILR
ncbi:MAG: FliI/YscN family ATPase [Erysipelotrichaceae bacterium]